MTSFLRWIVFCFVLLSHTWQYSEPLPGKWCLGWTPCLLCARQAPCYLSAHLRGLPAGGSASLSKVPTERFFFASPGCHWLLNSRVAFLWNLHSPGWHLTLLESTRQLSLGSRGRWGESHLALYLNTSFSLSLWSCEVTALSCHLRKFYSRRKGGWGGHLPNFTSGNVKRERHTEIETHREGRDRERIFRDREVSRR